MSCMDEKASLASILSDDEETMISQVGNYNPGQNSWDTNAIACQIEASSLPPSPSVVAWLFLP